MTAIVLSLWLREGPHRRWAHLERNWPAVPRIGDRVRVDGADAELAVEAVTWDVTSGAVVLDLGALAIGRGDARGEAIGRLERAGWALAEAEHERTAIEFELQEEEPATEPHEDGEPAATEGDGDEPTTEPPEDGEPAAPEERADRPATTPQDDEPAATEPQKEASPAAPERGG